MVFTAVKSGRTVQEGISQFATVPRCSSAERGDSGKRWRLGGLGLHGAHSAPHGYPQPSVHCTCAGKTGRLATCSDGELGYLCVEQIQHTGLLGLRLVFGSWFPEFASFPQHFIAVHSKHF